MHNATAYMFQVANMSVTARFREVNFTLPPDDPRSDTVARVDGSMLTAAYVRVREGDTTLKIEYDAVRPFTSRVKVLKDGEAAAAHTSGCST